MSEILMSQQFHVDLAAP